MNNSEEEGGFGRFLKGELRKLVKLYFFKKYENHLSGLDRSNELLDTNLLVVSLIFYNLPPSRARCTSTGTELVTKLGHFVPCPPPPYHMPMGLNNNLSCTVNARIKLSYPRNHGFVTNHGYFRIILFFFSSLHRLALSLRVEIRLQSGFSPYHI